MKCTFLILAVMFLTFDYCWAKEKGKRGNRQGKMQGGKARKKRKMCDNIRAGNSNVI